MDIKVAIWRGAINTIFKKIVLFMNGLFDFCYNLFILGIYP